MGSVLRSVQARKRKKCFGEVEIIGREAYAELELDSKVELIRSLIPLGLMHVQELLIDLCITNRHSSIVARQLAYETTWES